MDFIAILSIFVMACFVGYYVVWSVTPALHTPLMAVTNAISSVIIVGALVAAAAGVSPVARTSEVVAAAEMPVTTDGMGSGAVAADETVIVDTVTTQGASAGHGWSKWLGLLAVVLASINIFGGFAVTARMLAMYKKKERKA